MFVAAGPFAVCPAVRAPVLREHPTKGLDFPQTVEPDNLDFVYFSFIIGITSQVSDVQITLGMVRRLALLHGIVSFAYNTIIIALTISTMASALKA